MLARAFRGTPVPNEPRNEWGRPAACARGVCTKWFPDKGDGFLRLTDRSSPAPWTTDPQAPDSPYVGFRLGQTGG